MGIRWNAQWYGYVWLFVIASIPFVLDSGRLVQDSLFDVPEAYLVCIPIVTYLWISFLLRGSDERPKTLSISPIAILVVVALVGLLLVLLFQGRNVSRFNTSAFLIWPVWMGLVAWALYGRQALGRIVKPLLYLYLVWPPLFIALINSVNPTLRQTSYAILNRFAGMAHWVRGAQPGMYFIQHHGHWIWANVTAACSGSDSVLALLVIFPVSLLVFDSSRLHKLLLIVVGCLLALVANNVRIMIIFAVIHFWGFYWGFKVVHPILGPILFLALLAALLSYGGLTVSPKADIVSVSVQSPALIRIRWLLPLAIVLAASLLLVLGSPLL